MKVEDRKKVLIKWDEWDDFELEDIINYRSSIYRVRVLNSGVALLMGHCTDIPAD